MTRPLMLLYIHDDDNEEDAPFCTKLGQLLRPLERRQLITSWSKRDLVAGDNRADQIDQQLERADLIVLLISPNFLASEDCDRELQRALARRDKARIVPILLRPGDYEPTPIATLPSLPRNGGPVTSWRNRDEAWHDVSESLRQIVEELQAAASGSASAGRGRTSDPPPQPDEGPAPPPLDKLLGTLKAKVEAALQKSSALVAALASRGYREADDSLRGVASALIDRPARNLTTDLAELALQLPRDREIVRGLLWQLLPLATDWRDLLLKARAAQRGSAIELPLRTETMAEIILAGVYDRCCWFAPGDVMPRGVAQILLPAAAHGPFFDPSCAGLVDAVLINLYEQQSLDATGGMGNELWRSIKGKFSQYPYFKLAAKWELNASSVQNAPHYMLVIDGDLDPQQTRDLDGSWTIAKAAFAEALPGLHLVRLKGGLPEFNNEYSLVPFIRKVRDLS